MLINWNKVQNRVLMIQDTRKFRCPTLLGSMSTVCRMTMVCTINSKVGKSQIPTWAILNLRKEILDLETIIERMKFWQNAIAVQFQKNSILRISIECTWLIWLYIKDRLSLSALCVNKMELHELALIKTSIWSVNMQMLESTARTKLSNLKISKAFGYCSYIYLPLYYLSCHIIVVSACSPKKVTMKRIAVSQHVFQSAWYYLWLLHSWLQS